VRYEIDISVGVYDDTGGYHWIDIFSTNSNNIHSVYNVVPFDSYIS